MHGHDNGAQFLLTQVLDFVDQDGDGCLALLGCFGNDLEKVGASILMSSLLAVSLAGSLDIQVWRDITHGQLDAADKGAQHGEVAFDFVARIGSAVIFSDG